MSLEQTYSLLSRSEQQTALDNIDEEIVGLENRLEATRAGRAVLIGLMESPEPIK